MVDPVWFWPLVAAYLTSLVLYFVNFEFQKEALLGVARRVVFLALAAHFCFIVVLLVRQRPLPLAEASAFAVPLFILFFAYFIEWRYGAKYLMLFCLPVSLILSVFAIIHWRQTPVTANTAPSAWFWLHVAFMLTGLVGLVIAVSSAAMYLLQSAQLKSKHLGKVFLRLPSLDALDRLHFRALVIGVVFFSFGILGGIFRAKGLKELGALAHDPKVMLSYVTCILYWLILSLRLSKLRRGQKIALSTVVVFAFLLGAYFAPSWVHSPDFAAELFRKTP